MRGLSGSRGSRGSQDAPLTEDAAEPHETDEDLAILAANATAKKPGGEGEEEDEGPSEEEWGQGGRGRTNVEWF